MCALCSSCITNGLKNLLNWHDDHASAHDTQHHCSNTSQQSWCIRWSAMYCNRTPCCWEMNEWDPKHLYTVYGSAMGDKSTTGHWARGVMLFKTKAEEFHDLPCSGHWLCEQDKVWYQQGIHTLVPHRHRATEVAGVCGTIGYGVKPSLFTTCNFHAIGINI